MNRSSSNGNATRLDRIATATIFAATLLIVGTSLATTPAVVGLTAATSIASTATVAAHVSETGECPQIPAIPGRREGLIVNPSSQWARSRRPYRRAGTATGSRLALAAMSRTRR